MTRTQTTFAGLCIVVAAYASACVWFRSGPGYVVVRNGFAEPVSCMIALTNTFDLSVNLSPGAATVRPYLLGSPEVAGIDCSTPAEADVTAHYMATDCGGWGKVELTIAEGGPFVNFPYCVQH